VPEEPEEEEDEEEEDEEEEDEELPVDVDEAALTVIDAAADCTTAPVLSVTLSWKFHVPVSVEVEVAKL